MDTMSDGEESIDCGDCLIAVYRSGNLHSASKGAGILWIEAWPEPFLSGMFTRARGRQEGSYDLRM